MRTPRRPWRPVTAICWRPWCGWNGWGRFPPPGYTATPPIPGGAGACPGGRGRDTSAEAVRQCAPHGVGLAGRQPAGGLPPGQLRPGTGVPHCGAAGIAGTGLVAGGDSAGGGISLRLALPLCGTASGAKSDGAGRDGENRRRRGVSGGPGLGGTSGPDGERAGEKGGKSAWQTVFY